MEIMTKVAFMGVVKSPAWGLSPDQVLKIEAVIDGSSVSAADPAILSYEDAAKRIGLTAKNRSKTIALWVRLGKLTAVKPQGKKAIGVTLESVEKLIGARA